MTLWKARPPSKGPAPTNGPIMDWPNRCPLHWFRLQLFTRAQVKKKIWYIHKSEREKEQEKKKRNKLLKEIFSLLFLTLWLIRLAAGDWIHTGSHQLKPFVNKNSKFRALILTEENIALVEKQLTNFLNVNKIICEASAAVTTCQKNLFTNHHDRNYWNEETYPTDPEESHVNQTPAFLSPRLVNWGHLTRGAPQVGWPRLQ